MLSFHFCCMYLPMSGQNKARRRTSRKKLEAPLRWAGEERAALQPPQWLLQPEVWQLFPPKPQFGRSGSFHNTACYSSPPSADHSSLPCLSQCNGKYQSPMLLDRSPMQQTSPMFVREGGRQKNLLFIKNILWPVAYQTHSKSEAWLL